MSYLYLSDVISSSLAQTDVVRGSGVWSNGRRASPHVRRVVLVQVVFVDLLDGGSVF